MALKNLTQMEPMVLKVTGHDGLGRPRSLEILYDHETVDVSNPLNREFLVAYMPKGVLKKIAETNAKKKASN